MFQGILFTNRYSIICGQLHFLILLKCHEKIWWNKLLFIFILFSLTDLVFTRLFLNKVQQFGFPWSRGGKRKLYPYFKFLSKKKKKNSNPKHEAK